MAGDNNHDGHVLISTWSPESSLGEVGIDDDYQETRRYEMRRWTLKKRVAETLAGPGCHVAKSPDGKWFAGETWYNSDSVVFKLYRRGGMEPEAEIFSHPFADTTWASHRPT
ncbi:MAG: hypothetical protein AAF333_00990 [Planctomycetota bacterium]